MSATVPQHCPSARELDDLELLGAGAVAGVEGFNDPGSPLTLTLPEPVREAAVGVGAVELVDPEGLPLARVAWPQGRVEPLAHAEFGAFRRLHLSPAELREQPGRRAGRTVVPVVDALTSDQIEQLAGLGPVVLLALVGHGTPLLPREALLRATLRAADLLPDALVVAVPLATRGDPAADRALRGAVLTAYAGTDPVVEVPAATGRDHPPSVAEVVAAARPAPAQQGLVLFFTGLSGSGKSTLARALTDLVLEQGTRTVTSLDGDVVRRSLSAGLTFSREDRETNIRRIGWVAAEISRHGGVAVVSPIAPFDETRQQVRAMVEAAGGAFFLIHVATPLAECERRDRKGLYAKARRGEIPEFTGISSPYEEPLDADVRVDTTGRTIPDALGDVLEVLRDRGYVDLSTTPVVEVRGAPATSLETPTADHPPQPTPPAVEVRGAPATSLETPTADHPPQPTPPAVEVRGAPATSLETPAADHPPQPTPPAVEVRGAPATSLETPAADDPPEPLRVLFVCTANICRSPTMELLARQLLPDDSDIVFSSAGTRGYVDSPADDEVAAWLGAAGAEPTDFRSRPLTKELLTAADLVLTAETAHRSFILDDHPVMFRKVLTLGQLAEALGRLDTGLPREDLVRLVGETRRAADPAYDVVDPYRRGAAAVATAAEQIRGYLEVVVPALSRHRA